jgi:cation transport ATPase
MSPIITGDNAGPAKRIAGMLGIDNILANVLPGRRPNRSRSCKDRASGLARLVTEQTMRRA